MQYYQDILMTHQRSSIFYDILLCLLLTKKIYTMESVYIHSQIKIIFKITQKDSSEMP